MSPTLTKDPPAPVYPTPVNDNGFAPIVIPPDNCNVAPLETVIALVVAPSALPFDTINVPFETVVLPV